MDHPLPAGLTAIATLGQLRLSWRPPLTLDDPRGAQYLLATGVLLSGVMLLGGGWLIGIVPLVGAFFTPKLLTWRLEQRQPPAELTLSCGLLTTPERQIALAGIQHINLRQQAELIFLELTTAGGPVLVAWHREEAVIRGIATILQAHVDTARRARLERGEDPDEPGSVPDELGVLRAALSCGAARL